MNCNGCQKQLKKKSKSGYCGICFHKNIDNVKTKYNKLRWISGIAKESHWKARGVLLEEKDITLYNSIENCELCGNKFNNDKVLDHCHKTGKYRGALCRQCNASLGKLGDDINLVISNLKRYRDK
jgi:hypothetical protein